MSEQRQPSRVLGEARDCNELVEIYRARKAELNLTDKWFDERSGLAQGHVGKLLGEAQVKNMGAHSIYAMNLNLAVKFIVVVDEQTEEAMRPQWEERERPRVHAVRTASLGKTTLKRVRPHVMREMQNRGRDTYRHVTTQETRTRVARTAAKARWKQKRARRKARVKETQ